MFTKGKSFNRTVESLTMRAAQAGRGLDNRAGFGGAQLTRARVFRLGKEAPLDADPAMQAAYDEANTPRQMPNARGATVLPPPQRRLDARGLYVLKTSTLKRLRGHGRGTSISAGSGAVEATRGLLRGTDYDDGTMTSATGLGDESQLTHWRRGGIAGALRGWRGEVRAGRGIVSQVRPTGTTFGLSSAVGGPSFEAALINADGSGTNFTKPLAGAVVSINYGGPDPTWDFAVRIAVLNTYSGYGQSVISTTGNPARIHVVVHVRTPTGDQEIRETYVPRRPNQYHELRNSISLTALPADGTVVVTLLGIAWLP